MRPTAEMLPKAFRRLEGKELLELARKLHAETMQLTARQTSRLPLRDGCQRGSDQLNLHAS